MRVIRYTTNPGQADANAEFVTAVFRELAAKTPDEVRYAVLRFEDGTFLHLADVPGDGERLTELASFQAFVTTVDERRTGEPARGEATIVGNYRMLA
ncbi:MAG TPA: hypothetical protein VGN14_00095 [Candidatus Elarobacter sp.]